MLRLITWETWRELDAPILEQKILRSEGLEGNEFTFLCLGWEQDSHARARVRETAQAKTTGCWGSVRIFTCCFLHLECLCSSLKGSSQASPFFWIILWHLHHNEFLLLFLNLSCNRYHTAFEFLHVFPLPDTHCPIHLCVPIP